MPFAFYPQTTKDHNTKAKYISKLSKSPSFAVKSIDDLSNEIWAMGSQPSVALELELWGEAFAGLIGFGGFSIPQC